MTQTLAILQDTLGVTGLLAAAGTATAAALILLGAARQRRFQAWCGATVAAAAAVGLALVASGNLRSIEVDRSAEVAAAEAAGVQAAQTKLRSRAAGIRFAEDTVADQVDVAGVTVAEEEGAYERAVAEELAKIPAYRRDGRKTRSGTKPQAAGERMKDDAAAPAASPAPEPPDEEPMPARVRRLPEAQLLVADRFDRINRGLAWGVLMVAAGLCGCEYLRRFNTTLDAVLPLPLAGTVVDGLTAKEYAARLPAERLADFLHTAVRKGETFIVFTATDPLASSDTLDRVAIGPLAWRLPKRSLPAAALAADPGLLETVFETAWFGRGCFVVCGDQAADAVLERMIDRLELRGRTRARTRRTLDLVWALPDRPPPAAAKLGPLGRRLNVRWIISSSAPRSEQ